METAPVDDVPRLFVRPDGAAKALGIARSSIFVLIDKGELRSVRYGRRRMIPWAEVERFAAELLETADMPA